MNPRDLITPAHKIMYQVFISSTSKDLAKARKKVAEAVLKMGHHPFEMGQLAARDEKQLAGIERAIDNSDFFIVILGRQYGSIAEDGISFTEKEFELAKSKKLPIIALLHESLLEHQETLSDRHQEFLSRVRDQRSPKLWKLENQLTQLALQSLVTNIRDFGLKGWHRPDETFVESMQVIPSLIVMPRRIDHFSFNNNGTCTLDWEFDIDGSKAHKNNERDVLFPIYAELDGEKTLGSVIRVESVRVDGREVEKLYRPIEMRRQDGDNPMEFGALCVPVRFDDGKLHTVNIRLHFEASFREIDSMENLYIEVPYVTNHVKVILSSESGIIFPGPAKWKGDGNDITASHGMVETIDHNETHKQRNRLTPREKTLEWETQYPKLGYRYTIRFHRVGGK